MYIPSRLNCRVGWRGAFVMALAFIAIMALAACGSDSTPASEPPEAPAAEPAPEPTAAVTPEPAEAPASEPAAEPDPEPASEPAAATPEPAEAPAPEPAAEPDPEPASEPAAEAPQPVGSLEDLVLTRATTANDMIVRLSEPEASCIQATVGGLYGLLSGAPLLDVLANPTSGPVFACLTPENFAVIGVAVISEQAGGLSAETYSCMIDVAKENPDLISIRSGSIEESVAEIRSSAEVSACLNSEESGGP